MTKDVMTITEFLLARIAEDETIAHAALGLHWHAQGGPELRTDPSGSAGSVEPYWFQIAEGGHGDGPSGYRADGYWERMRSFWHIGRHDPARVLAECEAKRAIVEQHPCVEGGVEVWLSEPDLPGWDGVEPGWFSRDACGRCYPPEGEGRWPCSTVRALASVYADHPDYDPAWAL